MPEAKYSMTSRTGSDNQRYGTKGERLVAGVVALNSDKSRVMLIQSSSRKGWVLPKGGWEKDEKTASAAAAREAWEEAGIIVRVDKDLGTILDSRQTSASAPKACYQFFEVCVLEERAAWPEKAKRERKRFTWVEASAHLGARPELLEALKRSGLRRS